MSRLLAARTFWEFAMLFTILLIVLVLALIGGLPTWPYSTDWGYYPSGGIGILLVILVVILLSRRRV